jgi:hypothetical protein
MRRVHSQPGVGDWVCTARTHLGRDGITDQERQQHSQSESPTVAARRPHLLAVPPSQDLKMINPVEEAEKNAGSAFPSSTKATFLLTP